MEASSSRRYAFIWINLVVVSEMNWPNPPNRWVKKCLHFVRDKERPITKILGGQTVSESLPKINVWLEIMRVRVKSCTLLLLVIFQLILITGKVLLLLGRQVCIFTHELCVLFSPDPPGKINALESSEDSSSRKRKVPRDRQKVAQSITR